MIEDQSRLEWLRINHDYNLAKKKKKISFWASADSLELLALQRRPLVRIGVFSMLYWYDRWHLVILAVEALIFVHETGGHWQKQAGLRLTTLH